MESNDPLIGLQAVGALHRLAERVEWISVDLARRQGFTWEQIGDALGMSRQAARVKHGK
ncbi:hypothetical protein [Nonomuraea polychroma]|uniref:hypothetical protein n=1 Tax=Nonomuraea polychroma TaxID=46176 RepID=UPI003BAD27B1